MVEQLKCYTNNIYIVDNCSTYVPLINYLNSTDVKVIRKNNNYGHFVVYGDDIRLIGGSKYIITDPDLFLNKQLPKNFIDILCFLSDKYKAYKVGFALDITNNIRDDVFFGGYNIKTWESQFWSNKISDPQYELYNALIDTTFCLINYDYDQSNSIRVAGEFTAIHRPWVNNWKNELSEGELEQYQKTSICSSWTK
jgi:hypothetical protein